MEQNSPAVQGPLDGGVRPCSWRREWNGDDSDLGAYVHADYEDELDGEGQWQPLYDQAALEAAVAAERERCAKLCEALPIIGRSDQEALGFSNALETCAAEIRRA